MERIRVFTRGTFHTMDLRDQLQTTLGDAYRIERELGGGGMSRVFIAEEIALGRKVVVKVLPPEMAAAVSVERFKREISLAARLQHPHIVQLLNAGQSGELPYFTMPYVAGESLRLRLEREGELPIADAIRILREIATALDCAHEKGVVHRDIKPDNVLLSHGSAMVTDFGVAKAISVSTLSEHHRVTSLGIALGTPDYMSPEQATGEGNVDARADIYAFGAMAYELLGGRAPFAGRTPQATLAAHIVEMPQSIAKFRPSLPAALVSLIMRCLEKHASDRPQSAAQIVRELDSIIKPSGGSQPPDATLPPPLGRRVMAWGGVAALGAMLLVAAIVFRTDGARSDAASRAVAVLPFENVGGDSTNEYFAAGMGEALTAALSKVPGISVRALQHSSRDVGTSPNIAEIGRTLKVFAVLEGKVQKVGGRVRLTASLTRVNDGTVLWSDTYTKEARDVFAIQDEVARAVAGSLRARFADAAGSLVQAPTNDLVAYDTYLRGRFLWNQRTKASLERAVRLFMDAIERDPGFALAYAGLADAYVMYPLYAASKPIESYSAAEQAARQALSLDSTSAEAHATIGLLHAYRYRWDQSNAAFEQSIALKAQYPTARHWYGLTLAYQGRLSDSREQLARARELDPTSRVIATAYAIPTRSEGKFDQAIGELQRALELDPDFPEARRRLARLYALKGDFTRAESEIRQATEVFGFPERDGELGYILALAGKRDEAEQIAAELIARSEREYVSPGRIALVFVGLDDRDRAFHWLSRAVEDFDQRVIELRIDPLFWSLRDDPRYKALLARLNLAG